ncbi:nicotinate (nicotinamide) nucleotide adenylyltransferase [Candidatus Endolissoclinum faulkneri L2]|uniref:Probable nicotinate-nucleotide adenylyltransferase n=1 Tax=Candidatus Endolissoclinum faulkneri L2 TaxID=1193729 RepID=K7Z584_9PROT|nr:nicotinate-nucleotide adenylyltransferase [Candidatus Endolissoclinum faulkneri]AFX99213.1 nicotinate (nicotinamide) nucleotide adenylyltransferase [Candidatus Endolissoclinum faulkneri L2]
MLKEITQLPHTLADRRRITVGLMGGSFNPAHDGHRYVAKTAMKRLRLKEVWWLVSPQNPLKSRKDMATFAERVACARTIARHPRIKVKDIELHLGTQYTADTLATLRLRCPNISFVWIMGADNLVIFHRWKRWLFIFHTVAIAVFDRPTYSLSSLASQTAKRFARVRVSDSNLQALAQQKPPAWAFLHTSQYLESSTRIRAKSKVL